MRVISLLLFFLISFLASAIGAVCGIGGGIIIKPVLDLFGLASVSAISFLSSCTILSMSLYSVVKSLSSGEDRVDIKNGTSLAIGGAVGGILGKQIFGTVKAFFANPNTIGAVQAACLALLTFGTVIYTVYKKKIPTRHIDSLTICLVIGLALGILSSFLGIGGGPINLAVLFYFFSMDTKAAAQNSLYIILFSQAASLITALVTNSVPEFEYSALLCMVAGGIGGGMAGRMLNRKLDDAAVDKLFVGIMTVVICICICNMIRYAGE